MNTTTRTRRRWSKPLPMTPERQAMHELATQMRRVQLSGERIPQWMRDEYSKRVAAHHAQITANS